jgi:hypothetical protein
MFIKNYKSRKSFCIFKIFNKLKKNNYIILSDKKKDRIKKFIYHTDV